MAVTTVKLAGREYVLMTKREYDRVEARLAEDARDVARAKKAYNHYKRTGKGTSAEDLKRALRR